jgi:hypothetical protein
MSRSNNKSTVLAVDLDGTLLCGDLSRLSLLALLRRNPLYLLVLPLWLWRGKAVLKNQIARRVSIDPAGLDYHPDILVYIRERRAGGCKTVLATGSDHLLVDPIAGYLGCFDEIVASDGVHNRTGSRKRAFLVEQYGAAGYDYIGNSRVDIPVWRDAGQVLVASGSRRFSEYISEQFVVERMFLHYKEPGEG